MSHENLPIKMSFWDSRCEDRKRGGYGAMEEHSLDIETLEALLVDARETLEPPASTQSKEASRLEAHRTQKIKATWIKLVKLLCAKKWHRGEDENEKK